MGFKWSLAFAQTTGFKRKLHASHTRNSNPFTPPATPFNSTSYLIQLHRRRERGGSTFTNLRFNQYGSMENMIACCYFAISSLPSPNPQPPITAPSSAHSSNHSISNKTHPPHSVHLNSDPDGSSQTCDSPPQLHSCSDEVSLAMKPKLEAGEADGVQSHRQHFMHDYIDTQFCADSGSQTGTSMQ